jgi:hypothetical protein
MVGTEETALDSSWTFANWSACEESSLEGLVEISNPIGSGVARIVSRKLKSVHRKSSPAKPKGSVLLGDSGLICSLTQTEVRVSASQSDLTTGDTELLGMSLSNPKSQSLKCCCDGNIGPECLLSILLEPKWSVTRFILERDEFKIQMDLLQSLRGKNGKSVHLTEK